MFLKLIFSGTLDLNFLVLFKTGFPDCERKKNKVTKSAKAQIFRGRHSNDLWGIYEDFVCQKHLIFIC